MKVLWSFPFYISKIACFSFVLSCSFSFSLSLSCFSLIWKVKILINLIVILSLRFSSLLSNSTSFFYRWEGFGCRKVFLGKRGWDRRWRRRGFEQRGVRKADIRILWEEKKEGSRKGWWESKSCWGKNDILDVSEWGREGCESAELRVLWYRNPSM